MNTKRFYNRAKDKLQSKLKEALTIDDKEATVYFNPVIGRMEITPLELTPEKFHVEMMLRLQKRGVLKMVNCYIEGGKVILQRK